MTLDGGEMLGEEVASAWEEDGFSISPDMDGLVAEEEGAISGEELAFGALDDEVAAEEEGLTDGTFFDPSFSDDTFDSAFSDDASSFVSEAGGERVPYVDADGNAMDPVLCKSISGSDRVLKDGWFVAQGEVHYPEDMVINGTVNLILADGCLLTVDDGVWVGEGTTLNIWSQSQGDEMGRLIAKGTNQDRCGIGSSIDAPNGIIRIYGGNIDATGAYGSPGIGSSHKRKMSEVTIAGASSMPRVVTMLPASGLVTWGGKLMSRSPAVR